MAGKSDTGFGSGNFNIEVDKFLEGMGKPLFNPGGAFAFLAARAEEVLQQREATFLSRSQRAIAVQNIGGGILPEFDNSNLYGFALMTFTGGWDSGWNVVNIRNVLKPPITAMLVGGDDVGNTSSYFFNVNPKAIALSEPSAVHIVPTQNNGFYIESQGIVLRRLSIAGTTGFRPSATKLSDEYLLPRNLNEPTGFLNHIKLRNLFRNYSTLKKDPKQAKNTFMVWYNGRTQEAWFCEPESFSSSRDASSPFISRYEIGVTLTHKVAFSAISTKLSPGLLGPQFWLESIRLASVIFNRDNVPSWMKSINNYYNDALAVLDGVSKGMEQVEQYATNAIQLGGAAIAFFPMLALPVLQKTKDIIFGGKRIVTGAQVLGDSAGATFDVFGEMWKDSWADFESTATSFLHATNALLMDSAARGNKPGTNLARDSAYYPDFSDKLNAGEPNDDYTYIEAKVPTNVDDISTIMGNHNAPPAAKPLFWAANKLKYPYISAVPSGNTVKPGDTVYIPYPNGKKIPPNLETKLFPLNITLGLYQELLGRDIKLVSLVTGTGQKSFDFSINDIGDLELVESNENMVQAIYIKLNVERGELELHPGFGFIDVIGMKSTLNLSFAANLSINDTMLSDGRIDSISGLTIAITGDRMDVSLNAHIIGNDSVIPVTFSLGA